MSVGIGNTPPWSRLWAPFLGHTQINDGKEQFKTVPPCRKVRRLVNSWLHASWITKYKETNRYKNERPDERRRGVSSVSQNVLLKHVKKSQVPGPPMFPVDLSHRAVHGHKDLLSRSVVTLSPQLRFIGRIRATRDCRKNSVLAFRVEYASC